MTAAVHKWEICFEGDLLVFPIKTSIEVVKLIREGGGAGWGRITKWFKVCDGLYASPYAPQVREVEAVYMCMWPGRFPWLSCKPHDLQT